MAIDMDCLDPKEDTHVHVQRSDMFAEVSLREAIN